MTALPREEQRLHAVMGLLQEHEGEYRAWDSTWGDMTPTDTDMATTWTMFHEPAPDDEFFKHHQLMMTVGMSGGSSLEGARNQQANPFGSMNSSILRMARDQPLAEAFEARNVYIVNLPELFLHVLNDRTAGEVYQEWLRAEVIIGRRPRREQGRTSCWRRHDGPGLLSWVGLSKRILHSSSSVTILAQSIAAKLV